MKRLLILAFIFCILMIYVKAQSPIKLNYFTKIPATYRKCGALYTYDTTDFAKNEYIMIADFKNKGIIMVAGKQIILTLTDTKLVGKTTNVLTYTGGGYIVVLSAKTIQQTTKIDTEEGKLEITKGKDKLTIKIHGQSHCDDSGEEGN